jgi:transcriptional regulator with XRE-family HTH domain
MPSANPPNRTDPSSDWFPEVPLGRLTYIQEEIARLCPPWDDVERLSRAVLPAYQEGLLMSLCDIVRSRLTAAQLPQNEVAAVLGVSAAAVSQWFNGGGIKASRLTHLLHHFRSVLAPDPMGNPRDRKEMAVGGYTQAMFFIRSEVKRDGRCVRPIGRAEFACLERSFTNAALLKGEKVLAARQILAEAEQELASLGLKLQPNGPAAAWIGQLMTDWGWAFLCSVSSILNFVPPAPDQSQTRVAQ